MARPKKDPNIKRKEFIEKATELFFEKGYDDTSVQDILSAVGKEGTLSPSVFYYYFKSKDEIFEAVMREYVRQYIAQIIEVARLNQLSYAKKIRDTIDAYRTAMGNLKAMDAYFDQGTAKAASYFHDALERQATMLLVEPLEELLRQGIESGDIPQTSLMEKAGTQVMARIFIAAVISVTHRNQEDNGIHHSDENAYLIPCIFEQLFNIQLIEEE